MKDNTDNLDQHKVVSGTPDDSRASETARPYGYYWVRMDDIWEIANWEAEHWWLTGSERRWLNSEFAEIGPAVPVRSAGTASPPAPTEDPNQAESLKVDPKKEGGS